MRSRILIVFMGVSVASSPGAAWSFEGELKRAHEAIMAARQGQAQDRHDQIVAAIGAQSRAVSQVEAQLTGLRNQAQAVGTGILGPQNQVSAAAKQLLGTLNSVLRNVQDTATAVSRIAFSFGLGKDDTLLDSTSGLQQQALQAMNDAQNATDQICVMVVDPLRQRKMYSDAQPLATSAPTLAKDGEQLGEEAARLYDVVSGESGGPISTPHENLCDPTRPPRPFQGELHLTSFGQTCGSTADCNGSPGERCVRNKCLKVSNSFCVDDSQCISGVCVAHICQ